jgi:Protein of unknown function (DUF3108)
VRYVLALAGALVVASLSSPAAEAPAFNWDKLTYGVEWRLVRSGSVEILPGTGEAKMHMQSAGLLSALFKVDDQYTVHYDANSCATDSVFDAMEGKHLRQTTVTYDRSQHKSIYVQRDLATNTVMRSAQADIPDCPRDMVAGLLALRGSRLEPGQSMNIVLSEGRKTGNVKLEAQEREEITTPAGTFKTIRYDADIFGGVIYMRKGRALIWVTDDAERLPVEIKLRFAFPIGTVTLDLEKGAPEAKPATH